MGDKKHLKETGVRHGENPTPPPAMENNEDHAIYHGDEISAKNMTGDMELVDTRDDHEIVEEDKKHLKETGVRHGENPPPPPAMENNEDHVIYHGDEISAKNMTGGMELVDTRDDHEIVEEDKKHLKETGVRHGENPTPPPAMEN